MMTLTREQRTVVRRKLRLILGHVDDLDELMRGNFDPDNTDDREFLVALDDLRAMIVGTHLTTRGVAITTAVGQADVTVLADLFNPPEERR